MVGSTVPIAVLAVPVRVLAVHWGRAPWRLGAPDTVLVLSLDMGESLSVGRGGVRRSEGQEQRLLTVTACSPNHTDYSILYISISAAQEPQYSANTLTAATS